MTKFRRALVLALAVTLVAASARAAILKPTALRCEYKPAPLAISSPRPRLSWLLVSDKPLERGQTQSAYQILVASTRENLDADKGDLWDTDKLKSDETIQIEYAGSKLAPAQEVWWKVRVWNEAGAQSPWSDPATWTMSPDAKAFKAKWIGYDAPADDDANDREEKQLTLDGLSWIWTDEGDAPREAPAGERFFAKKVSLPDDAKVRKALILLSVDDHADVVINSKGAGEAASFKSAHQLDVTTLLKGGDNVIAIKVKNGTGPAGLIGRLMIFLVGNDEPITVNLDKSWKFSKEKPADWPRTDFDFANWPEAKEVLALGGEPWKTPDRPMLHLPPPPYLRKAFKSDKEVKRALVHASALGLYELHLNGERIGRDFFTPGWTDYKKRIYFNTYDVTPQLQKGDNVIAAILGDGWYAGYYTFGRKREIYGKDPRLFVQLDIEYADGSKRSIVTDNSWKCGYGPLRGADLLQGAIYDANQEIAGWDKPGFDDSAWEKPAISDAPKVLFQPYPGDPIRTQEELPAKAITEPSPGVYVFDLGQNMVGWVRLKIAAEKGTRIQIRHTEMLAADGTLYTIPLRSARAIDYYIAKGDGSPETWEPKFTSHGFRYVEITGVKDKPNLDAITGIVANADMPRTGTFTSSNQAVNQLFSNIIWGQKGNYFEVPTDCPQRDERMGWTGDAQVFIPTAAWNFDVAGFFTKWLVDLIDDAQNVEGKFADVAPDVTGGYGNTAWGDAGIICPYIIYQRYGDKRIIEKHYDSMAKFIDWLGKSSKDLTRKGEHYGDWVNLGGGAKSEVIGTAYYEYSVRLMSEMAAAIGKSADAAQYEKLADDIRKTFIRNYVKEDGSILDSSQTGYALAFAMNLVPSDRRDFAGEKFVDEIRKKDWHLATGFLGTPRLLPALTAAGRNDIAYKLFLTDTFPSWLYQVKLGATTMWERWDGWTPEKGFQDPAMNSFNHYAFGSVGQWMYSTIAGIDTDGPAFKKITLKPQPPAESASEGLDFAKATYDSIRGRIESHWRRDGASITYKFIIPPNTTATVRIPAAAEEKITESAKPARESEGIKFLWTEPGATTFGLTSGTYEFVVSN